MTRREKWREMIDHLKAGGRFYCHKGVPLAPDDPDGFAYSRLPDGRPNERKLRLCRGYLNALSAWWAPEKQTAAASPTDRRPVDDNSQTDPQEV